ncbi:unnamed protein product [Symbiodinium pilosum]|uniref:Uncharacterized protein n=1 Tax=Symbiodinium pilosum TaxID=2952 RepID=A0A812WI93_SYMPI|nr:unnamed protein product [Symbiodinium pilosum]
MSDICGRSPLVLSRLPPEIAAGETCNHSDQLEEGRAAGSKLVWFFRHGQSTGNAARLRAMDADKAAGGGSAHLQAYMTGTDYVDAQLTAHGAEQAEATRTQIVNWKCKPSLVVCSPMTRAIQTAAILFSEELMQGCELIICPELREFYPDNNENQGRTVTALQRCPALAALAAWPAVEKALAKAAGEDWRTDWDESLAGGEGWQHHCGSLQRLAPFRRWLLARPESNIAIVAHYGSINNLINMEPFQRDKREERLRSWSGVHPGTQRTSMKYFPVPNCGWIAVLYEAQAEPDCKADGQE